MILLLFHQLNKIEKESGYSQGTFQPAPPKMLNCVKITQSMKNTSKGGEQAG